MHAVMGRVHEHGIDGVATFAGFYSIKEGGRVQAKYPHEEMLCMTWCTRQRLDYSHACISRPPWHNTLCRWRPWRLFLASLMGGGSVGFWVLLQGGCSSTRVEV
jgi:hypothetical protein